MPTISILMPVYNVELYIAEAIESILSQTFEDFEFIVINDGSTDRTSEIVLSFNDPRILFINNIINKKKIACLNDGLRIAKGDFVGFMDGDDIAAKTWLEKQYSLLIKDDDIGVCGTWFESFGDYSQTHRLPLTHDEIYFNLLTGCPITHPLIRKRLLNEYNIFFDPEFFSEDSYLLIKLADITRLANNPEVLYKYRVHANQVTQKFKNILNESLIREKKIHFNNLYRKLTSFENISGIEFQPNHIVDIRDLKNYESLTLLLFNENREKRIFSQDILQETLSEQFFRLIGSQSRFNLYSMIYFYLSPLQKYMRLSFTQHIKFIVKSIFYKRIKK